MLKQKKIAGVISVVLLSLTLFNEPVYAKEVPQYDIETRAQDTILVRYRVYQGRTQYRRWNESRKIWVDPYWRNV